MFPALRENTKTCKNFSLYVRQSNATKTLWDRVRFYGPSRLFHSFWAESIVRWGENKRAPKNPPDHQAKLGLNPMKPELGSNPQRCNDECFIVLKISILNHSATGGARMGFHLLPEFAFFSLIMRRKVFTFHSFHTKQYTYGHAGLHSAVGNQFDC